MDMFISTLWNVLEVLARSNIDHFPERDAPNLGYLTIYLGLELIGTRFIDQLVAVG